jgi:predicted metallo-beta-lactamase superfamily hydrolase
MKVIPVASESLGVRSMATVVKTERVSIFIDPGVALSPSRFNLPPHPLELKRKEEKWHEIVNWVKGCEVIIVTHYHYDHHNPEVPEIYQGKICFLKDPWQNINESQKKRAGVFLERIRPLVAQWEIADGQEFFIKDVRIKFSPPVFHGRSEHLGFVTEVLIEEEKRFLFTSDVQGPVRKEAVDFILANKPDIIFADGPMTYLLHYRYSPDDLERARGNIIQILKGNPQTILILDHHLTRDENYKSYLPEEFIGRQIFTAAEFLGEEEELLEAKRRDLYQRARMR